MSRAILLGVGVLLLGGCQTVSFHDDADTLGYRTRAGDPPSLVFSPPEVPGSDDPYAWFADRGHYRPSTSAGFRSATVETITNLTVDRQRVINGTPRDNFRSTTFRSSTSQTIR